MRKSLLILIGGAEDRKDDRVVLRHLVKLTQAENVVIIPTASAYPQDIYSSYIDVFRDFGVRDLRCLDIRYREEADSEEYIGAVDDADLVYFSGGDQVKLVRTLNHTRLMDRISQRFEEGSLHIGGTSAGATAAGNPMIYNGNRNGFQKGSVKCSEGFAFIDDLVIDTHFSARKRLARLSQFLVSDRYTKGIGLDEDTGIVVYPNMHFRVIGSGMVTVVNSSNVTGSNYKNISNGDAIRFNNMRIGCLPAGTLFSIKKWSVLNRSKRNSNYFEMPELEAVLA
ncbi:putative Cyanophycinase [Desulfamplus magnetovallimortis]|uniref:Cyanophycinase n=1 Tax=Desulfamplus magnetovallimortis TaxID=1246637 RepID=A0A1W1HGF2_9BACT|nr:cyanophycinase [Desulfamplus magnetovallimortis]SLM31567.1 putative Cyanophycinase [Desulfamplus magnetovallimortis]